MKEEITDKQVMAGLAIYFGALAMSAIMFSMGIVVGRYGEKWWVLIAMVGLFWIGIGIGKNREMNKKIASKDTK